MANCQKHSGCKKCPDRQVDLNYDFDAKRVHAGRYRSVWKMLLNLIADLDQAFKKAFQNNLNQEGFFCEEKSDYIFS